MKEIKLPERLQQLTASVWESLALLLAAVLVVLAAFCSAQPAQEPEPEIVAPVSDPEPVIVEEEPEPPEVLEHRAFLFCRDGFFRPEDALTRGELAAALSILAGPAGSHTVILDVKDDEPHAQAMRQGAGYLTKTSLLEPNAAVSTEVFLAAVHAAFPDGAIPTELQLLEKDAVVTRSAAAGMLEALSGRQPDTGTLLQQSGRLFMDVSKRDALYAQIAEAAVSHTAILEDTQETWQTANYHVLQPGVHTDGSVSRYLLSEGLVPTVPGVYQQGDKKIWIADEEGTVYADEALHLTENGVVYCRKDGSLLTDATLWDEYFFDADGYYSCGDEELDTLIAEAIAGCTTADMTQEEKLRACYCSLRDDYKYLGRNAALDGSVKRFSLEQCIGYAKKFLQTGKGDCYNYAGALCLIARALGFRADSVVGVCGYSWSYVAIAHGWVEITRGDETLLYDAEIENYNNRRGISNELYGAFGVTYAAAPARYISN